MKHFYLLLNIITVAMVIVLLVSLFKPNTWLKPKDQTRTVPFPSFTGARIENIKLTK
ncbi:MAG: hypothetical protein AAB893_01650 [Patescibacteria group bacterium]